MRQRLAIEQIIGPNNERLVIEIDDHTSNGREVFSLLEIDPWNNVDARIRLTISQLDELINNLNSIRNTYAGRKSISKVLDER